MVKEPLSVNCIFGTYGTRNPLTRSFFTEMLFLSKNRQIHKKSTFWQQTLILHSNDTFHVANTFWVTKLTLFGICLNHYKNQYNFNVSGTMNPQKVTFSSKSAFMHPEYTFRPNCTFLCQISIFTQKNTFWCGIWLLMDSGCQEHWKMIGIMYVSRLRGHADNIST